MNKSLSEAQATTSQPETSPPPPQFNLGELITLLNNETDPTESIVLSLQEKLKNLLLFLMLDESSLEKISSSSRIDVSSLQDEIKKIILVGLPDDNNQQEIPLQNIAFLKFLALTMFLISYNNVGGKLLSRPEILELAFHLSSNDFYRNLGSTDKPMRRYTRILELLCKINPSSADINFRDQDVAEIIKSLRIGGNSSDLVTNLVVNPFTVFRVIRCIINEDMSEEDESVRLARLAKKRQNEELADGADSNKVVPFPITLSDFFNLIK